MNKIDELNNAFIDIISEDITIATQINKELIEGNYTTIEEVILKYDKNIERDAKYYYLISVLTAILEKRKMKEEEKITYASIILITSMYSTRFPLLFARKIDRIFNGVNLSETEKQARKYMLDFFDKGKTVIKKIERGIIDLKIKEKSNIYRDVKAGVPKKELIDMYADKKRVRRAIRTEAHAELEEGKLIHAKGMYEFKIWHTRRDNKVRNTNWHTQVEGMKIPIGNEFRANGLHAMYPGDISLPIGERINCRCYLTYE